MFNKLYEKIKHYIKYNLTFFIILALVVISFNIDSGYSIYKPGGIIDITPRIKVNDLVSEADGSLNMAYVGMIEGKLPFYLLAKILPSWDLVENKEITYHEEETIDEAIKRDHLYYDESISNAKYLAYTKAQVAFKVQKTTHYVVMISTSCTADLEIGDELLKYDEHPFVDLSTLKAYINTKNVDDEIKLLVKKSGKEMVTYAKIYQENGHKLLGVSLSSVYDLTSKTEMSITAKASESGPSGGLMLSLAIYNALMSDDITKGLKIVGTGTIDLNGQVGAIGGVKYKIASAAKAKADLFLVPEDNYAEASAYAKKQNYDIIIKSVSTFDEALLILKEME